jgi:hypothetical protein
VSDPARTIQGNSRVNSLAEVEIGRTPPSSFRSAKDEGDVVLRNVLNGMIDQASRGALAGAIGSEDSHAGNQHRARTQQQNAAQPPAG